ncbi:MalY/PatB family protein [Arenibacterium halophilum]|uniref:cysteine-S-conjugate beta-lyase n=1 Tax=Arenibacterium halophilum TaxID=2583821 RepID=A0ABY2X6Q0_9RHOB|nr:MalY/PatB family protein [Arenibacterium halophilum]TMV11467.1 pyridoxal phosphate-dependent aminotransferase [Arenibacterium halophilum]
MTNFNELIERRGTHSSKWDMMEAVYGVSADDGLPMWVADMDFRAPDCVVDRLRAATEHGIFAYANNTDEFNGAIQWWMRERHGWEVQPDWIFTTTGLVNGVGMCLDAFTQPGDQVLLFTPVYHAFAKVIRNAGREVVECPMPQIDGRYVMDTEAAEALVTGRLRMVILCSPHNPGGRVWSVDELRAIGDFCKRHDLLLLSDEIHHDIVFDGHRHTPMPLADPSITDRLLMLTAPSKTFNVAGLHTGNVIIQDETLRARFAARMSALNLAGNSLGQFALAAAYSPEGAVWVDQLVPYLDANRHLLDETINAIPGLRSMPLESTFLAWVDFSGTGMTEAEFLKRVEGDARIAVNHGKTFGTGGAQFMRFNFGTQRARIEEACKRLNTAFADLQ